MTICGRQYLRPFLFALLKLAAPFLSALLLAVPAARANTALDLDGVDDRLLLTGGEGSVYDVASSNFTLEMWVKTSSTTAQGFFSKRNDSGLDDRYALAMRAEGTVAAAFNTGSDVVSGASTVTVNDGNWHHLAMVRTGTYSLLVYIDGVLAITGSQTGPSTLSSIDTDRYPAVGSDYTGSRVEDRSAFMDGQIDELRFGTMRARQRKSRITKISSSSAGRAASMKPVLWPTSTSKAASPTATTADMRSSKIG